MNRLFDAVCFDLDGTLIDSVKDIAAAANCVRRSHRLPDLPVQTISSYVGDGVRTLLEKSLGRSEKEILDQGIEIWWKHYREHCLDQTVLYPGIFELLQELKKAGVQLGVVTNKPYAASEIILKGLKIHDWFGVVVGADSTPKRKPDPEPLFYASKTLGVELKRILMVGDGAPDVLCAHHAGCQSCAVLWGLNSEQVIQSLKPSHVFSNPDQIRCLILNSVS
jgi:phosphoglycolate phosphatase